MTPTFTARLQGRGRLARRLSASAHRHDHPLGVVRAEIIEQMVLPAGQRGEAVHGRLNRRWDARVKGVHRLPRLEKCIRVVGGAADEGALGIECPLAVRTHEIRIDHCADLIVAKKCQGIDLVRGTEAVEEMDEGDTRLERRRLGDQRVVMGFLHRSRGEECEASGPRCHHIGMVAENRKRLRRDGPGGNVKHRRRQLARDLVHIGQHQHQALRRGEGRGQRARLQRSMHRAGGAALALHLLDDGHIAPNVLDPQRRPLVGNLRHRRGRGDGIDRADLVDAIGDMGDGRIAVHCRGLLAHHIRPSLRRRDIAVRGGTYHAGSAIISMAWQGHCSKQTAQPVHLL